MCGERVQTAETWLRNPVEDGKYGGQDPGNRNEHPWSKAGLESHAARGRSLRATVKFVSLTVRVMRRAARGFNIVASVLTS
jgi:hypothetical protein